MEIVRRLYERWGRGDAALDLLDPEIEIAMPVGRPDEQRYHGHTGFDGWGREWIGAWETHRAEVDDCIATACAPAFA